MFEVSLAMAHAQSPRNQAEAGTLEHNIVVGVRRGKVQIAQQLRNRWAAAWEELLERGGFFF